jgi:hypothetical protein
LWKPGKKRGLPVERQTRKILTPQQLEAWKQMLGEPFYRNGWPPRWRLRPKPAERPLHADDGSWELKLSGKFNGDTDFHSAEGQIVSTTGNTLYWGTRR